MNGKIIAMFALAGLGAAAPVTAATTVLDFSGNICGVTGNLACNDGTQIGQNYGDSAALNVAYRSILTSTNTTAEAFLKFWGSNYGDLVNVVWGGSDSVNYRSEITFTPAPGFEVALITLDAGCYFNRASCRQLNYDIRVIGGAALAIGSMPTFFPLHGTLAVNSAYYASGIVLSWGPDSYDTGLDNITFDVRAIAAPGIPEPASWALLIGGFTMVGGAMRTRRQLAHTAR